MARQRQVFPTSEIPHKWAHQTQPEARNPQGNLYFRGDTLYSYRDSYPIAKLFRKKGAMLALHVENTYSMTTAGHCSDARRATLHLPSIVVPDVRPDNKWSKGGHAANLEYFQKEMARLHAEAGRVMTERNVQWRAERCAELHKDIADYMMFFGIRRKMPALLSFAAHYERARRIENPDPASADKRERASAKRRAVTEATREYRREMARSRAAASERANFWPAMAARTDWRLAGAFGYSGYYGYGRNGAIMLRINGDQIETSAGARIPLAAAPMVWGRVQRALGVGYKPAGLGVKIGDYPLTEIRPDGTLVAGCHKIPHSELRSMARALGLAAV